MRLFCDNELTKVINLVKTYSLLAALASSLRVEPNEHRNQGIGVAARMQLLYVCSTLAAESKPAAVVVFELDLGLQCFLSRQPVPGSTHCWRMARPS